MKRSLSLSLSLSGIWGFLLLLPLQSSVPTIAIFHHCSLSFHSHQGTDSSFLSHMKVETFPTSHPPTFSYWITLSSPPSLSPFFSSLSTNLLSGFLPLWIDFQFLPSIPNSYLFLSCSSGCVLFSSIYLLD